MRRFDEVLPTLVLLMLAAGGAMAADRSVTDVPYHARADMKVLTDAVLRSGSPLLSSASAAFTSADVGKAVVIAGAGGGQAPEQSPMVVGTMLGMVEGFGSADAPPFLTLSTDLVVEGLAVYDPCKRTRKRDRTDARPLGDQHHRGRQPGLQHRPRQHVPGDQGLGGRPHLD